MSEAIVINDRISIGGQRTFVIAEVGSNHNQNFDLACETIDAASEAGADAVKFQSIRLDRLYLNPSPATVDLHRKIDFPEEWHAKLKQYCDGKGILFFSSPTYLESIDILEAIDVPLYKLASAQIGTFPQLVEKVIATGKPVLLSTGIVNCEDLKKVVHKFRASRHQQFVILHCNSIYPTPFEKVHLPLMDTYREMFECITGFSDHTLGVFAPIAAVARGAKVIEKHFTLSRDLPVPDASFSLEPLELKTMIDGIRATEAMVLESSRDCLMEEESAFKKAIGTKLVLKRDISAGVSLAATDSEFRRVEGGVACAELGTLLERGACYAKEMKPGHVLVLNDLKF